MNQLESWRIAIIQSFTEFSTVLGTYLPNLLGALAVLFGGWLLARGARLLILRLHGVYDRLANRLGWQRQAHRPSMHLPLVVLSWILYWLLLLFALTLAADILGMPGLATWLGKLFAVLPSLFAAGAIFLVGYLLANLLRESLISASAVEERARSRLVARLLHGLMIAVSAVIALEQLNIDVSLLAMLIIVAFAALAGAFGLAFGLGARRTVGNIIAAHYLRKIYRIGTRVQVDDRQGEVLDFTPTAVLLETDDGIVMVPAQLFEDRVSINLSPDTEIEE